MKYYAITDKGIVREENEDRILAPKDDNGYFIAVADGMGGHNAGEVASSLVIETLSDFCENTPKNKINESSLKEVLTSANKKVCDDAQNNPVHKGMGTTVTAAAFIDNEATIINVGDSRAYFFRNGVLKQITKDHSYVQMLIDHGYISKSDAMRHPHKNIITRAIGIDENVEADIYKVQLQKKDVILLCSDGLSNVVSDNEIASILGKDIDTAVERLLNLALSYGGPDNISIVVAYMDGDRV